jgi:hypothetical protein
MVFDVGFPPEFGVEILDNLSKITLSVGAAVNCTIRDQIYQLALRCVGEVENDGSNASVEYAKKAFVASFNAFRCVLVGSGDDSVFLSSTVVEDLFRVVERFVVTRLFVVETLLPFYSMLKAIAMAFGRRVMLRLHHKRIRDVVKFGVCHEDSRISQNAQSLETFLRNYK